VIPRHALTLLVLASFAAAACGDAADTPTSPSIPEMSVDRTSRLFSGTLPPRGSTFYSFTVAQDSGVFLTLASLTPTSGRGTIDTAIDLGLGTPRGTGCAVAQTVAATADLAAQISAWRGAGVHCVSVSDPGRLAGTVAFAVRIGYFE
jgi:hypothetical protein